MLHYSHITVRTVVVAALSFAATGCTDMYDTGRVKPLQESRFYPDRQSSRPLVEGTVPRGYVKEDELLYTGKVDGKLADVFPFQVTKEVVERGENRYNTFCSPCHGRLGDANGMIVQRGFPRPNSFHADSIRAKPAGHYFDVMTHGFGRMYDYSASVPVKDRWAIIGYIRALQLSRRVMVNELSETERQRIAESAR